MEAAKVVPDDHVPAAVEALCCRLAGIPSAGTFREALLDDQDSLTGVQLARMLSRKVDELGRDGQRSISALAAWRSDLSEVAPAATLDGEQRRALDELFPQFNAAAVEDWAEVAMSLGLPLEGSAFAEVSRERRQAIRGARSKPALWSHLVQAVVAAPDVPTVHSLVAEIRDAVGISRTVPAWVEEQMQQFNAPASPPQGTQAMGVPVSNPSAVPRHCQQPGSLAYAFRVRGGCAPRLCAGPCCNVWAATSGWTMLRCRSITGCGAVWRPITGMLLLETALKSSSWLTASKCASPVDGLMGHL